MIETNGQTELCADFSTSTRLMLLAPHPDDETIAAGGVLQQVIAAGGRVRVIYITDGDDNPWPQRAAERRWRIGPEDRKRWGTRRRGEALSALAALGMPPHSARFLGYPDQGMTRLLYGQAEEAVALLLKELRRWRPTVLLSPSIVDLHPDHSAVAILAFLSLWGWDRKGTRCYEYLVHGGGRVVFHGASNAAPAAAAERARKRLAILCHTSQLVLTRRRLMAMGNRAETFRAMELDHRSSSSGVSGPIRECGVIDGYLELRIARSSALRVVSRPRLLILGVRGTKVAKALSADLGARTGRLPFYGSLAVSARPRKQEHAVAVGDLCATKHEWRVRIALDQVGRPDALLIKGGRRVGVFDEAGWLLVGTGVGTSAALRREVTWRMNIGHNCPDASRLASV